MKKLIIPLTILLFLPVMLAINLDIEKTSENEVMISNLNAPAVFDLKITNRGQSDSFEFYNLLGFKIFPIGTTPINSGQTKEIKLQISPIGEFDKKGSYTFEYFIRNSNKTDQQEQLTFKIIELTDAFEIGSGEFDSDENSISIYIKNKVNFNFEEINAEFNSAFFNFEETFSLEPNQEKNFEVELDNKDFKKLVAGFYTLNADIQIENEKARIEGTIKFSEKNLITTTSKDYGFFINTKTIIKTNEGNVIEHSETIIKKNIVSRLFTSFSPDPDIVDRSGTTIEYTWAKEIKPGDTLEITTRTNWLFPILVILLIIASTIIAKRYSLNDIVLRKKVSFVRAKGGEFALKVTILINTKKYIERVSIIDRIPALVKVHEKFGGEQPSRIDERTKRIEWNFEKLEPGELRMISYIIYSKVGIVGRFALPKATAIYDKEGKIKETESNRAFFISETKEVKEDIED